MWEFLQAAEFEHASVQARVSMKIAFLEEMRTDSIPHEIHNLSSVLTFWKGVLTDFEHEIGQVHKRAHKRKTRRRRICGRVGGKEQKNKHE